MERRGARAKAPRREAHGHSGEVKGRLQLRAERRGSQGAGRPAAAEARGPGVRGGHVGTLAAGNLVAEEGSPAGVGGGREGPRPRCSRPGPAARAPAAAPRPQRPSSPRPRPSRRPPPAHRGSGLRPPRAPSAAPLRRRCRRRHLPPAAVTQRRRCTSRAAGKWSPAPRPVPAPTACRVGSRPPSPGVHRGGRHFRPSSAMPLGKCSPWRAGAGRK